MRRSDATVDDYVAQLPPCPTLTFKARAIRIAARGRMLRARTRAVPHV
jgi:hypothetical protein